MYVNGQWSIRFACEFVMCFELRDSRLSSTDSFVYAGIANQ